MIDWHSHVLPGIDDGSRDVAESISMIRMQKEQGVDTVIATPHFYANDESVDSFLKRRSDSYEALLKELPEGSPDIVLACEVRYYHGISKMPDLKKLRIENTKYLLLEMPVTKWTEYMVRELIELASVSGTKIILAHIERYLSLQKPDVWDRIFENGILAQVNASFFTSFATKRKAISFLREGAVRFIGSDAHNMSSRPPRIGPAFSYIEKKLGAEYLSQMNEYGYSVLGINK